GRGGAGRAAHARAQARRAWRNRVRGRRRDRRPGLPGRGCQRPRCGGCVRGRGRAGAAARAAARRGRAARNRRGRARRVAPRVLGGDAPARGAGGGARLSDYVLRAGEWEQVTPESAGWRYLYFGVRRAPFESHTGDGEIAIVPLGGRCRVEAEGESWELGGRASVFDGMPWALYLPRDTAYRVEGDAELAICGARCERRREPVLVRPEDVEIEVRGSGNATRQINHILKPEFPAERLLVGEVFTPS